MTREEKQLLLIDLSARLTYGVKCVSGVDDATLIIEGINPNSNGASEVQVTYERSGINFDTKISSIKPYLFPLSSMTEEQKKEYQYITERWMYDSSYSISDSADWLNAHHFDFRNLISRNLAIDCTNLNIY